MGNKAEQGDFEPLNRREEEEISDNAKRDLKILEAYCDGYVGSVIVN